MKKKNNSNWSWRSAFLKYFKWLLAKDARKIVSYKPKCIGNIDDKSEIHRQSSQHFQQDFILNAL